MIRLLAWILSLVLMLPALALSMETSGEVLSHAPVHVKADALEAVGGLNQVVFSGAVVANQGDLVIYSDRLTVLYSEDRKAMDRAEADGNVRIVRGEQVATAERAVYDSRAETIMLSGSPKVRQGESFLVGSEITIYLREQRSVVHGAEGGRVNAVFTPEEKDK